jgi:hypothetical protein
MTGGDYGGIDRLSHAPDHRAAVLFGFLFTVSMVAGEPLRPLNGPEIKARFSDQEFTGPVHSGLFFSEGGLLSAGASGLMTADDEDPSTGHWYVADDELCLELGHGGPQCYAVWASGRKVQLHRDGKEPHEGILQRPKGQQYGSSHSGR